MDFGSFKEVAEASKTKFADCPLGKAVEGKEVAETSKTIFDDCPLGKVVESKTFDKPASEYDKPVELNKWPDLPDKINDAVNSKKNDEVIIIDANLKENYEIKKRGSGIENEPNKIYIFGPDGIYRIVTDDLARQVESEAKRIVLKGDSGRLDRLDMPDNKTPEKLKGDHAGHIIADWFEGAPDKFNLVSMRGELNTGAYLSFEKEIAKGKGVSIDNYTISYEGDSKRPIKFDISYTIDGETFFKTFLNSNKGESNV